QQVLEDWNATETDYPHDRCVHQLFEQQAERTPEAVALVFEEKSLTYAELNTRANRLAHHLIELGIRPDDRVAIAVERSLEMVVGLLAILKAGGAYVPLDPAYPEERLAFMLEDSTPVALLVHGATRERFATLAQGVPVVDLDRDTGAWEELNAANLEPTALGLGPNHLAYVIYTSGSTGKPKGVMVEHSHAVNFINWAGGEWSAEELRRTLFATSINFDLAAFECFVPLSVGGANVIVRNVLDAGPALTEVSLINTVPSAIDTLLRAGALPPNVRAVNLAGEPLRRELAERLLGGSQIAHLRNLYGPSETTTYSSWVTLGRDDDCIPHIGRPIANTRIYLLDGQGEPVPIGVAGELHIGGAGVARGYLNRPELTAERFLPDPYSDEPNARMYRTGDLARWLPAGNLEYIGRIDFQVKIRGFRIELGEIETALRGCKGIREAVVLAREEGPGEKRLVAYVTTDVAAKSADMATDSADGLAGSAETLAGGAATIADRTEAGLLPVELKAQLRRSLPEHMVPAAFVVLEALPLTPNGKLDRKALPAPEAEAYATGAYVPPEGPVEESLAAIWRELLGSKRVGRH
ncbi:MAG: non-ribosomal peptide synthetase, partial [Cyanobacteriota bacterium]